MKRFRVEGCYTRSEHQGEPNVLAKDVFARDEEDAIRLARQDIGGDIYDAEFLAFEIPTTETGRLK